MSMHDYTQHSKKNQNEVTELNEDTAELDSEVIESAEDPVTEVELEGKLEEETKEEEKVEQHPINTDSYDIGVVTGCTKLRVRSEPRFGTNVICEIDQGTRVMIDRSRSTFDYYKIYTESGIEGFCVKTYIA